MRVFSGATFRSDGAPLFFVFVKVKPYPSPSSAQGAVYEKIARAAIQPMSPFAVF
jgi:hypothetical protein